MPLLFKNFFGPDNHVRVSELGKSVLDDKSLATKIAEAIINNKIELENGEKISVADGNGGILIGLSTSITEDNIKKADK